MQISSFLCVTNSIKRGDTFIEAIQSHLYWADELIIVDGGSTDGTVEAIKALNDPRIKVRYMNWPQEDWSWTEFPKHWNFGYEQCTGDWVAAGESDHIFHENDISKVRDQLHEDRFSKFVALHINKLQSSLVGRWGSKSRFPYFLNKKEYGDKIGYGFDKNHHTDLTYPIWIDKRNENGCHDGRIVEDSEMEQLSCNFYNYLWTFKTFDMILKERTKACNAWNKFKPFGEIHGKFFPSDNLGIIKMIKDELWGKHQRNGITFSLKEQPKIMQEKIERELKPGMYGYDLCGLL
jgi:glycosyltransferase involved in cell wall biosynthesis